MSFVKAPGQMLGGVRSTWACGHSGTSSLQGSGRRTSRCSHAQVARSVLSDRPSSGSISEGSDEKGSVFHKGGDLPKVPKKDGKVVLNDRYLDSAQYIWNVNFEVR